MTGEGGGDATAAYVVQPKPGGLCDAIFRAAPLVAPDEHVLVGLPDTVWFPTAALTALGDDGLQFLLFPVDRPEFFDAVVTDEDGRVQEVQVKSPDARSKWVWGAFKMPGRVFHELHSLVADGFLDEREIPQTTMRGRGRPARRYALTDRGRAGFPHAYDDLAVAALRHIAASGGTEAVSRFTEERVAGLEERCREAMDDAPATPLARAAALAEALTREGYAANASAILAGGQLCQHHCPVAPRGGVSSRSCARPRPR